MRKRGWRAAETVSPRRGWTSRLVVASVAAFVLVGGLSLYSSAATSNAAALKVLHDADQARALAASTVSTAPVLVAQNTSRDAVHIEPIRSASTFNRKDAGAEADAKPFGGALTADDPVGQLDTAGLPHAETVKQIEKSDELEKPGEPSSELVNAGTYVFAALAAVPLENMSSGTTLLVGSDSDDFASAVTPIGFEFWYDGVRQTQFSVNANGTMRLGVVAIGTAFSNAITSTGSQPQISPYWDDLWVGNNGKVHYKVVGAAPNRKLVVEWTGEQIPRVAAATAGAGTFQAWLFESTGVIQFVYGSGIAVNAANGGYTVGLGTSATSFAAVTTASASVSYVAANDTQTTAIASGTSYTFTPNAPNAAPGALSFTAVGLNTMTLNWADTNANEFGYAIYRSLDGVNYEFVGQTAANATSSVQSGLASNTTWFWKVVAVTEGAVSLASSGSQATTPGTVSGTISVGPTGTFTSIGAAVASINTNGLAGNVILELQPTYLSAVEAFPLLINALGSPSNTITIRPAAGAVALSITSANATATVDLNTATNVTIDGRAAGAGPSQLSIVNTAVTGVAVRLINAASRNTLEYSTIQGASTSTAGGVVLFSTTTGVTGNNGNTIDTCDVSSTAPGTTLVNGITSIGTASTALLNSGNTITNSNIFNFFSATAATNGILVTTNTNLSNNGWTISNNRLFQTVPRTYTTANTHRAILVSGGSDYTISGNTVGFSAAAGTGTYAMTGTIATSFIGIQMQVGDGVNTISGNTVSNISLQGTTGSLNGIVVTAGSVNVTGNTVGGGTGTGSLALTEITTSGGFLVGINLQGSAAGTLVVSNNTIGSLTATGSPATINPNMNVVQVVGGQLTLSNNLIGSNTTANSIQITTPGTSATAQQLIPVFIGVTTANTITGNTLANITNSGTGTAHVIRALQVQNSTVTTGAGAGLTSISLNNIHDISGANANSITIGGVVGLTHVGTCPYGASIDQNTVSAIINTNSGAVSTVVTGIGYTNSSDGTITRNKVCDLRNASTGVTATAPPMGVGIEVQAGLGTGVTLSNNMVSLGDGQATNTQFVGIMNLFSTVALRSFYNSVNITGAAGGGALPTYGFLRGDNTAASAITTPVSLLNNIFNNARTGGAGKHYAIGNVNTVPATGWGPAASNNNVLNSPVATTVGIWGLALDQTFAQWQASSGGDSASLSGVPVPFVGPCDLHLNFGVTPTPIESHGQTIVGLAIDYDNQTRPGPPGSVNGGGTAPDIGADEFDGAPGCSADNQCGDGNVCTDDTCDIPTATCVHTANTAPCDDGNACTLGDVCLAGVCTAGPGTPDCNDGNACTDDSCSPATGCVHVNNSAACDDGNICTVNDACAPQAAPYENFDGVIAPALPVGWTTSVTGTGSLWVTQAGSTESAPNSAFVADGATTSDQVLVSPPIFIYSAAAKLTFRNKWTFESATSCFDAGVLEIKIGAGAFTDIVTAGGSFNTGGYTGTVSASFGNPLGGRSAWCNTQATYITTSVNLPPAAVGQTVQLRWRVGTDSSTGATGQNIDSIVLTNLAGCQPGPTNPCDDGNACTADSCNPTPPPGDPVTGCVHVPIGAGGSCSDGDPCNGGETCDANGVCQPGTPITCDDFNPCTDDACVLNIGCVYTNDNTNTCSDGSACTTDACVNGVCVSTPNFTTYNGGAIDILDNQAAAPYPSTITVPAGSGNVLKVQVLLNGVTHTFPDDIDILLVGPTGANAVIMSDVGGGDDVSNVNLVLDDAAATPLPDTTTLVSGTFQPFNYDTASDPFTGAPAHGTASVLSAFIGTDPTGTWSLYVWDDAAQDVGSITSWSLRISVDCDDHNPCTDDSCDPGTGACVHTPHTGSCDDGSLCTTDDVCTDGVCTGTPTVCTASDQCHDAGVCDPGTGFCSNPVKPDGSVCSDGNVCTTDACIAGVCTGTPNPPPTAIGNSVRVDKTPTNSTISWTDPPGNYNVYRGNRPAATPFAYNHTCFGDDLGGSSTTDVSVPASGEYFYYLVSRDDSCNESGLGRDGSGNARPNALACP